MGLNVSEGEVLGIVGESGSGKTTVASAIMRMLPPSAIISGGAIECDGENVLAMPERRLRAVRGRTVAVIPQNPMTALNPVLTVGFQFIEAIRAHASCQRSQARTRAEQALRRVGIPDAQEALNRYPHEFSGGMRQRILIAMALANEPKLVVADEPTSALDATIQRQIIDLLSTLVSGTRMSLILISHDLGVVSALAQRICVMYAGEVVEEGPIAKVLARPAHPYTAALRQAALGQTPPIRAGEVAAYAETSCRFVSRCPKAMKVCSENAPSLFEVDDEHRARCFLVNGAAPDRPGGQT